jgi:predicted component of viral defense system (DUF524 family)
VVQHALQIGHRISVDLDLFTHEAYHDQIVIDSVREIVDEVEIIVNTPPFLQLVADGLKLDFLKFPHSSFLQIINPKSWRLDTSYS